MSIILQDSIRVEAPKLTDDREGPFLSVQEALTEIDEARRQIGQDVKIITAPGKTTLYRFEYDEDEDEWALVEAGGGSGGGGYIPISPTAPTYYEDGLLKRVLVTYPESKFKDTRYAYTNGIVSKMEVQNALTNEFKQILFSWVGTQMQPTEPTLITEFTITI